MIVVSVVMGGVCGCRGVEEAEKETRDFGVCKKITFIDLYTGEAIYSVRGGMVVERVSRGESGEREMKVVIRTGEEEYITHYFSISENMSYVIEEERNPILMQGYWEIEWYIKR